MITYAMDAMDMSDLAILLLYVIGVIEVARCEYILFVIRIYTNSNFATKQLSQVYSISEYFSSILLIVFY